MKKTITLAALCLLFSCKLFASHLASAEIRYEYTGTGNQYRIYLTLLKACEPFNASLASNEMVYISSSCASTTQLTLPLYSGPDTIANYCAGTLNSCAQTNSIYPGFERRTYSATVNLSACSDWKISWYSCCRNGQIANLSNPMNADIYVEATLDNSVALNTSAWFANPSPLMVAQNTATTIPLDPVDAENDSLVLEWYNPMISSSSTSGTAASYAPGFSFANPLGTGGSVTINANQSVTILAPLAGKFVLALKVSEYRNGVLVGTTMRDFNVMSVNTGGITLTVPDPASPMHYTTCPGASNTLTLNFTDPTPTDIVNLSITSPNLPGWTFTTSTTSGTGTGTANISWTTPTTMNPATLPQFYFIIKVWDNGCPIYAYAEYAVVIQTAQCNTDSVWSGDANADFTVNMYDPLAIAVALGQTGPARPGATTNWQAEYCPDWTNSFMNGVNMKHADCDGNGTVDLTDLTPVTTNYGLVHLKGGPKMKTTGVPDLYFDLTGINFTPGATVSVPIKLGSTGNMMNDIYGLASSISISGVTLAAPPTITYPASWIGNSSNTLNFTKVMTNESLDWAYARTNHQNVSGQGTIATLNFTLPMSIPANTQLDLTFGGTQIVDKDLVELPNNAYNVIDTFAMINPVSVHEVANLLQLAQVVPNPSGNSANLQFQVTKSCGLTVTVADAAGRVVSSENHQLNNGNHQIALPAAQLSAGVYLIRLESEGVVRTIKWIRH